MKKRAFLSTAHGAWVGKERCYRIIAERALGRPLPPFVIVHHHTEHQIVICENQSYHQLLHKRTNIVRAGGDPNRDRWCADCKRPRPVKTFYVRGNQCKPCLYLRLYGIKISDEDAIRLGQWSEARKARMGKTASTRVCVP